MKKLLLTALVMLLAAASVYASGEKYGKEITLEEKTKISAILESPEDYVGKKVLVEGMVISVCKKRGCWIDLASDEEYEKIRIKVTDGEIIFPMEAQGKTALVEGEVVSYDVKSEEACGDDCEEEGEHTHGETSETIYMIKGLGAVIN